VRNEPVRARNQSERASWGDPGALAARRFSSGWLKLTRPPTRRTCEHSTTRSPERERIEQLHFTSPALRWLESVQLRYDSRRAREGCVLRSAWTPRSPRGYSDRSQWNGSLPFSREPPFSASAAARTAGQGLEPTGFRHSRPLRRLSTSAHRTLGAREDDLVTHVAAILVSKRERSRVHASRYTQEGDSTWP
jgi:hypothetical protein